MPGTPRTNTRLLCTRLSGVLISRSCHTRLRLDFFLTGSRFFYTGRQESILRCKNCSTYTSPLGHCGLRVQVHCSLAGSIPAGHEKRILRRAGFNTPLKALTCAGPLLCAPARRARLSGVLWRSVLRARNRTQKSECTALLVNHHDAAQSTSFLQNGAGRNRSCGARIARRTPVHLAIRD